jgi:SAM-dependent methyltransferase
MLRLALGRLGLRAQSDGDDRSEGFAVHVRAARQAGVDVNDWQESQLGWEPALPILERVLFPFLAENTAVCELGIGTGRFSRHILARLAAVRLLLVDHSPWIVQFNRRHFRDDPRVSVHLCDGVSLGLDERESLDVVFSAGTFIELKLGTLHSYCRDFARVLKPGGRVVFDYIDSMTPEGWQHMVTRREPWELGCYEYHATDSIDAVLDATGFTVEARHQLGKSTYVIARRADRP